ncbi:MAG TPA: hypothetical protein VGJ20_01935 [Xanthobacteraceae bacterium]|jgi:hypothetical protein
MPENNSENDLLQEIDENRRRLQEQLRPQPRNSNLATKKVITLVAAAVIIVAAISYDRQVPLAHSTDHELKPVDFSFSLDCRSLDGDYDKPLVTSVEEYEQAYAEAKKDGNWKRIIFENVYYDPHARIAYNYGKADDGAVAWLPLFVTKVTPEIIAMEDTLTPNGGLELGLIDRRTGVGEVTHYSYGTKRLHKQYRFKCEPSPPAKF